MSRPAASQPCALSTPVVVVLAAAAGGALANHYAIQPSLVSVALDLGVSPSEVGLAATGLMVGYLVGLVLLVPLADQVRPGHLIPGQLVALAVCLGLTALAPDLRWLMAGLLLVGATASVAAQISAIVGRLADPRVRGRQMGVVSAGVSAGILLSRFVGGSLSERLGWRSMLMVFAAASLLAAVCTAVCMPHQRPSAQADRPGDHWRTSPMLVLQFPPLRPFIAAGMLWFFAFNVAWVGLSLALAQAPYSLGASAIGLYSLAGLLGLVVTPMAGRLADQVGAKAVKVVGLGAAASAACALAFTLGDRLWTTTALAVFDAGCFAAQVANQAAIVRLAPARAASLNSAYLFFYYLAGALGAALAGPVLAVGGWTLLTLLVGAAVLWAAAISAGGHRPAAGAA